MYRTGKNGIFRSRTHAAVTGDRTADRDADGADSEDIFTVILLDLANTEVFGSDTSDERVQNENCVSR